jgi:hypothetical protein
VFGSISAPIDARTQLGLVGEITKRTFQDDRKGRTSFSCPNLIAAFSFYSLISLVFQQKGCQLPSTSESIFPLANNTQRWVFSTKRIRWLPRYWWDVFWRARWPSSCQCEQLAAFKTSHVHHETTCIAFKSPAQTLTNFSNLTLHSTNGNPWLQQENAQPPACSCSSSDRMRAIPLPR